MRMSDKGRAMLMKREGVRLKAYKDSVGVWTIGVGHTSAAGPPNVTPDLVISAAQCDQIFSRDLIQYENAVDTACKRDLTQNQFDACVSLCYNIGAAGFARSTVVKRINAADFDGAANAFLMWNKPPEIIGRRNSEVTQFRAPYDGAAVTPPRPDVPAPKPPVLAKPAPPSWIAAILNAITQLVTRKK